ncbi:MAG TPA: thioredoxin domain-containing protein [Candidatus Paceibacterota bacterium]|nr:thioredoxin domain-containing protein [Candidatus Paceibacterota bacterium]
MENPSRSVWVVPFAIIVAGILLAGTIYTLRMRNVEIPKGGDPSIVTPVTPEDHLIGNPEAPVRIVEYSDIDSEHGKALQATLAQLMTEYAAGGQVAWVYRHFPLTTVHANSLRHALAAECAASLGAADAFWRFIDLVNAGAPGSAEFDPKDYPNVVRQLGIGQAAFDECLTSGRFAGRVRENTHNALAAGATGAPYTVILVRGSEPIIINGALPYASMKQAIEKALSEVK